MQCTTCSATLPDNAKFCNKCGRPPEAAHEESAATGTAEEAAEGNTCATCGAALLPEAKFCKKCGTAVSGAEAPSPTGEPAKVEAEAQQAVPTVQEGAPQRENACATCGASLLPDAKFCAKCGTTVATEEEAGEVKQPTQPETSAAEPPAGEPVSPSDEAAAMQAEGQPAAAPPPPPQPHAPASTGIPPEAPSVGIQADWLAWAGRTLQRIFLFDSSVYQELRVDPNATVLSFGIAAIAIFAFALGGFLWANIEVDNVVDFTWSGLFWKSALVGTLIGFGLWLAWITVAVAVLTQVYRMGLRLEEVFRVAGAASAPLAIGFFMFIPGISFGVALVAVVAWVATTIFALQAAFEMPPQKAVVASLAGFAVWAVILPLIVGGDDPLGPGIMLFDSLKDILAT